jgi:hypothetical protein
VSLDQVATHTAAKARLRELAWLIKHQKDDVLERGVLVPGRIGVGKSFLIDCFASECGLPVLEIGEFRSKWVGETERQQARILMTIRALGPVIVVVDEADAVFGNRSSDGDSGISSRVFAAFAAHLGDSSLRGRELWIAMTSRPDLMAIDLKRQGRFGLCVPLFAAQSPDEVVELFTVIARVKKITLGEATLGYARTELGTRALTGSDVEAILIRAKERAVLAKRDDDVRLEDVQGAVDSFIDPLDPRLVTFQELAAVLACSDRRFLPEKYQTASARRTHGRGRPARHRALTSSLHFRSMSTPHFPSRYTRVARRAFARVCLSGLRGRGWCWPASPGGLESSGPPMRGRPGRRRKPRRNRRRRRSRPDDGPCLAASPTNRDSSSVPPGWDSGSSHPEKARRPGRRPRCASATSDGPKTDRSSTAPRTRLSFASIVSCPA